MRLSIAAAVAVCGAALAQAQTLQGIYIYTNDVSQITNATATQLARSFSIPGVDGVAIVIGWSALEPALGQYDWTLLDQYVGQVAASGKKIDLVIPAGSATPSWLFDPSPKGAGATKLTFSISPHGGQTAVCQTTIIAPPWDPAFLTQWDKMLAAVSAHLKTAGTYNAVTLVRLTGINRTTEEMRLPAETAASTGLACVSDSISIWQQQGYRPSLLLKAWNAILTSFLKSFPDKPFAVSIIPNDAFPGIAEDGSAIKGAIGDENEPLLQSASQLIAAGKFIVQFDFLMPGEPVSGVVTGAAQTYGALVAFQTNEYLGGSGAACSEPVTNPTPCTTLTFQSLLETGIYPLGPNNPLRAQYIEVFHDNATAFPTSILQGHAELLQAPIIGTPTLTFVPGSSARLEQVIGDCDYVLRAQQIVKGQTVTCTPTTSQTITQANIQGTDRGVSFEDNGKLTFLFGDTKSNTSVEFHQGDSIASTTATVPEAPMALTFFKKSDGTPLFVTPPGVSMAGDETPNAGINLNGTVYLICNTGADQSLAHPQLPEHSVLAQFNESTQTFTTGRVISPKGGKFVYNSLHSFGSNVVMFGLGPDRGSDIYLQMVPASSFASGAGTQYFSGLVNGQPTWSTTEGASVPVVQDNPTGGPAWPNDSPTASGVSVAYSTALNLWLMTYDGGRQTPKTAGVYFTYASQPWGPWASPQLIFNDTRDGGLGVFLHDPSIVPDPPGDGLNGPAPGTSDPYQTRGASYGPFLVERFLTVTGTTLTIYYNLSTWNPYVVVRMRSQFLIATAASLSISTAAQLPPCAAGLPYAQTLAATGGSGAYTWSGNPPAGLTLSPDGVISGTPTATGTFAFAVQVVDSTGASASLTLSLTVAPGLILSPDAATVYDPVNDITWLANFNLAASNTFGLAVCKGTANQNCVNPSGSMHWAAAVAWVAAMNAASYLGQNNWQLPTTPTTDPNCAHTGPNGNSFSFNCTASALASLYNVGLGLQSPATAVTVPNTPIGGFSNFQPYLYWTQGDASTNGYSTVSFNTGFQGANTKPNFLYVLPLIPGKITGAPAGTTVYDSTANVTWLANANIAASNSFQLPPCTSPTTPTLCVASDGAMSWDSATQLVANMNAAAYLGQKKWQLPPADSNCTGYNCSSAANPLTELYYGLLNLNGGTPVVPTPNTVVGAFSNIQPYLYWSCLGDTIQSPCSSSGPANGFEWTYSLGNGFTGTDILTNEFYVTAYFQGPPSWYSAATPLVISTSALPTGTVGVSYSQVLSATGGAPPYTWSVASGSVPAGLALTADGTISGTPTAAGTANFTLQVMDANSVTATLAASLTIQTAATPPPDIAAISICSPNATGGQGSCPAGTQDTAQIVLAPGGGSINGYNQMTGISDEHQSIFPPGALNGNSDYVFFVATSVKGGAPSTSLMALSGGSGPAANGQWTFDLPKADGYDAYPNGVYNDIFTSSTANCPAVSNAANQDQTFDQSYAAPGSLLIDPSAPAGSMLMIYEGTNTCLGITGGSGKGNFYSTVGIATSLDYGHTWPTYRGTPTFAFTSLPGQNKDQAPNAPMGATGAGVCMGNSCTATPPASYGRYAVLGPSVSIGAAAATGKTLPSSMGDSEMAAFLDDASSNPAQYVYIIYDYKPGTGALADPKAPPAGVMIARAALNGGTAPLSFMKWNGQAFASPGIGGYDSTILPGGSFSSCGSPSQIHFGASISFVDATQQYLLLFICDSPGDPAAGSAAPATAGRGAAWFYSTSRNLGDPTQWTVPQEIAGSFSPIDTSGGCSSYPGFYPTAMSLGAQQGHLSATGYIFYLWGCQTVGTPPPGRQYSSRTFTMTLTGQSASSPPLTIAANAAQLQSGTVGTPYSQTVQATGGVPPYAWSLASGSLPPGLAIGKTGSISGTPAAAGTTNFTLQVTDSVNTTATLAATLVIQALPGTMTFYVSPGGKDSWSGTAAASNPLGTDGPFATFDAARAAVQALNKSGLTQVTVQFRGGTYYLQAPQQLTAADSGTASMQIIYQNYPGETPVFSGGVPVTNWTNVSGNQWTTKLPASTQYFENLFYNGARRLRPRLGGMYLGAYNRIAKTIYLVASGPPAAAPNPNCSVFIDGFGWECFDRFQYDPKDPIAGTWKNLAPAKGNPCNQTAGNPSIAGDIEILDFEQFSTSKLRVSCIDTSSHIVYMTGPTPISQVNASQVGFIAGNRYLVENVQDQLTQPGQWFLDHSTTPWTLTYLTNPGENPNADSIVIPQSPQLLVASGLQYVTFQGLTFEQDNYTIPATGHQSSELEADISAAVSFQNSQNITFDSGTVRQTSGAGLEFISCINATSPAYCAATNKNAVTANDIVQNSAFYDLGALGIRIGDPYYPVSNDINVPQQMLVQNNVVEGYGRTIPASFGIGQGYGHDNLYTHNEVYDGYHCAISISLQASNVTRPNGLGNANNTISFNHVYNLLQGIMNDGGSIRIESGNQVFSSPGNKILNNKIHDVTDASIMDPNGYGGHGIYMDNQTGLVDVENNLVYRVSASAFYTPHGPAAPNEANIIKNNIFAYAQSSMAEVSGPYDYFVPTAFADQAFAISHNIFYFDRSSNSTPAFRVQSGCTYAAGFPFNAFQLFSNNLYWRTDGAFASDAKAFHVQLNAGTGPHAPCSDDHSNWTFYTFAGWQQQVTEDLQSIVQNPGFHSPAYPNDDYTLPNGSPLAGFVIFDSSQAGRSNPTFTPPPVGATFVTKTFDPSKDY